MRPKSRTWMSLHTPTTNSTSCSTRSTARPSSQRSVMTVASPSVSNSSSPADAEARALVRTQPCDVRAVERHDAAVRDLETGDDVEQRRLTRAVGADESRDDTGIHGEIDAGERRDAPEADGDPGGVEERHI